MQQNITANFDFNRTNHWNLHYVIYLQNISSVFMNNKMLQVYIFQTHGTTNIYFENKLSLKHVGMRLRKSKNNQNCFTLWKGYPTNTLVFSPMVFLGKTFSVSKFDEIKVLSLTWAEQNILRALYALTNCLWRKNYVATTNREKNSTSQRSEKTMFIDSENNHSPPLKI